MKEKIVINKMELIGTIFCVALLFPILSENIVSAVFGDLLSKIFSMISCMVILLLLLKKKIKLNIFFMNIILQIVIHLVITFMFLSSGSEISVANSFITPYGLIAFFMLFLFIDISIYNKTNLYIVFNSMTIIMTVSVLANFFLTADLQFANNIETFREAFYTGYTNSRLWLYGHRNVIFIHHVMWMVFSYISYGLNNKNYNKVFICQILFTLIVGFVSWNSTMIFVTFIILIFAIFRNNLFSKITIIHYVLLYFILEISVVFLRIQDVFSYIIVNVLHRNLSFTGRTSIWNVYIDQFINGKFVNKMFGNFGFTFLNVNTHNMFLGLLSFTGIIGSFLYFHLLFLSMKNLIYDANLDSAKFVSVIMFGFLINALMMEFYLQPMIVMYIGYRIKDINKLIYGRNYN